MSEMSNIKSRFQIVSEKVDKMGCRDVECEVIGTEPLGETVEVIESGDVVWLKSGSPVMTVGAIKTEGISVPEVRYAQCSYFVHGANDIPMVGQLVVDSRALVKHPVAIEKRG